MPSVAQLENGLPVLTGFGDLDLKIKPTENGHFQKEFIRSNRNHLNGVDCLKNSKNGLLNHNGVTNGYRNGHSDAILEEIYNNEDFQRRQKMYNGNHHLSADVVDKRILHTTPIVQSEDTPTTTDPSLAWKYNGKVYDKGPNQVLPTEAIYTWHPEGATKISRLGNGEMADRKPMSVPSLLMRATSRAPFRTALAVKRNGEWQKWTYTDYLKDVRTAAKGFIALGLERYHAVCILGFNSPEWYLSDLGAIFAGGFVAGIYTTNSPESCAYVAIDSRADIFVVEDEKQLSKIMEIRDKLPHLKAIIQYTGEPTVPGVYSWSKFMMLGAQQSDDELNARLKTVAVNQCCTLIYTSGTTGNPKGVMLSHDNMTWTAHVNAQLCGFRDFIEEYISFLPLSHVAAQMADIYCPLTCSATVFFADKNALKGTLIETMKEVKPTKFLAVPRVWEKMYEKMMDIGRQTTGVKKMIATWAKSKGLDYNMKRMNGIEEPETTGFKVANKVILTKIRDALGLTRCDLHLSGAAPINPEILKYFYSLNIVVTEVYGMSECSGPHAMAVERKDVTQFRIGSCGKTIIGASTKLANPDADGNGEVCMGGRHVCMGYLQQPEKTSAAIDKEGWLHSEDIGRIDSDGFLYITGRLKEIIITAGGENVAPVPIEDNLKTALPLVSQAVLLGDRLKFLSVLLTLKTDVDKETQEPLDTLLPVTKDWLKRHADCHCETVQEVMKELYENNNKELAHAIQGGIDAANRKAPSQAQKIQKWVVLQKDFSVPGGELGPTLKLKRQTVYDMYKDTIANLYE